jgi:hypothetical protein
MAVGKRLSADQPLTEHDLAERLDRAALRVWRILQIAEETGLQEQVRSSRYLTNSVMALRAKLEEWDIPSVPMPASREPGPPPPSDTGHVDV